MADLDSVGDAVLYSIAFVNANELRHCMIQKYPLNPSATKIIRSGKCLGCEYSKNGMRCAAQGVLFSDEMNVSDDVTEANKEAREIQSYFAGCSNMVVEIDEKSIKRPIEIEIPNPGEGLIVDSGDRSVDTMPGIMASLGQAEMQLEIDPPRTCASPLKIGGLNKGFDIDF